MRSLNLSILIILSLLTLSMPAYAEIFRWVDENGKTQFSDKPPKNKKVEDISKQLETKQNTDYSSKTTKGQVQQYQRDRSAKHAEQKQIADRKRPKNNDQLCKRAKKQLKIINGRVIFLDDDGKEIKTSEKKRAAKAATLEAEIRKRCSK